MTKQEALKLYEAEMAIRQELLRQEESLRQKRYEIEDKAREIFVKNELYSPISELEALGERRLHEVYIYYKLNNPTDEDEKGVQSDWLNGDILKVENGRLYFSDYYEGIIEWDEEEQCYYWIKYGNYTPITIVGYSDLKEGYNP